MKSRIFYDYDKAYAFRDNVDGQTHWNRYRKGNQFYTYWIVWYE